MVVASLYLSAHLPHPEAMATPVHPAHSHRLRLKLRELNLAQDKTKPEQRKKTKKNPALV